MLIDIPGEVFRAKNTYRLGMAKALGTDELTVSYKAKPNAFIKECFSIVFQVPVRVLLARGKKGRAVLPEISIARHCYWFYCMTYLNMTIPDIQDEDGFTYRAIVDGVKRVQGLMQTDMSLLYRVNLVLRRISAGPVNPPLPTNTAHYESDPAQ